MDAVADIIIEWISSDEEKPMINFFNNSYFKTFFFFSFY